MAEAAFTSAAVRAELVDNILPFWSEVAMDRVHGGVHGQVSNDLVVDDGVERTAVLCARVLWAFSAAARSLSEPRYLATAALAYDYLRTRFTDPEYGGVFWSVDVAGNPVNDRKQLYAQAFAIYALAEYARAADDPQPLREAAELIELIERHGADPSFGGYLEAVGRDWRPIADQRLSARDLNAPKSMNTLLHVMEAYTNYVQVTGDDTVRGRLAALVTTILDHVVDLPGGRFELFFDLEWHSLSNTISYGHDIEGAWLLVAAAEATRDAELISRAETAATAMAAAVYRDGREPDGAIRYEYEPATAGRPARVNHDSHWWVQAEGAVGFLEAYRITGESRFAEAAAQCWQIISAHHVDRVHGDWFKVLDEARQPRPTSPKVGPWECPYHHVRACLQVMERLSAAQWEGVSQ